MSVERDIRFELLARLCPNSTGTIPPPTPWRGPSPTQGPRLLLCLLMTFVECVSVWATCSLFSHRGANRDLVLLNESRGQLVFSELLWLVSMV